MNSNLFRSANQWPGAAVTTSLYPDANIKSLAGIDAVNVTK